MHGFRLRLFAASLFWLGLGLFAAWRLEGAAGPARAAALVALAAAGGGAAWFLSGWLADWFLDPVFRLFRRPARDDGAGIDGGAGLGEHTELAFLREHFNLMSAALREQARQLEMRGLDSQKAQEIKVRFVRNMSHHLRTPLNTLVGSSRLLRSPKLPREKQILANAVHQSAHDLSQMVTNLLTLAEIDSGMVRLSPEWMELRPALKTCSEQVRETVCQIPLKIRIVLGRDLPKRILADSHYLSMVLVSAIRTLGSLDEKGDLRIKVRALDGRSLELALQAAGVSLTEDECARAFERFPPIDKDYGQQYPLLNVNLSLVAELCAVMGGVAKLESLGAEGCRLTLLLPLAASEGTMEGTEAPGAGTTGRGAADGARDGAGGAGREERAAAGAEGDDGEGTEGDGARELEDFDPADLLRDAAALADRVWDIVIAEDDKNNQFILEQYLKHRKNFKATIRLAKNGREVLDLVGDRVPDLILMDVMMPEMGGLETTGRLKRQEATRDVPVIAITSMATGEDRHNILAGSFDDYLPKPINAKELYRLLDQYLKGTES